MCSVENCEIRTGDGWKSCTFIVQPAGCFHRRGGGTMGGGRGGEQENTSAKYGSLTPVHAHQHYYIITPMPMPFSFKGFKSEI